MAFTFTVTIKIFRLVILSFEKQLDLQSMLGRADLINW